MESALGRALEHLLGERTFPAFLVVCGVLLFFVGSSGGWPYPYFEIKGESWRLALVGFGTVVALFGGLLIVQERKLATEIDARKYGFRITFPTGSGKQPTRDGRLDVSGDYKIEPPDSYRIGIIQLEGDRLWFKVLVELDQNNKTWHAPGVWIGKTSGHVVSLVVALIGRSSFVLWNYHMMVGNRLGWIAIPEKPADIHYLSGKTTIVVE